MARQHKRHPQYFEHENLDDVREWLEAQPPLTEDGPNYQPFSTENMDTDDDDINYNLLDPEPSNQPSVASFPTHSTSPDGIHWSALVLNNQPQNKPPERPPYIRFLNDTQKQAYIDLTLGRSITAATIEKTLLRVKEGGLPFTPLEATGIPLIDSDALARKFSFGDNRIDSISIGKRDSPERTIAHTRWRLLGNGSLAPSARNIMEEVPFKGLEVRVWEKRSLAWLFLHVGDKPTDEYPAVGQILGEQLAATANLNINKIAEIRQKEARIRRKRLDQLNNAIPVASVDLTKVADEIDRSGLSMAGYIRRFVQKHQPEEFDITLESIGEVAVPPLPKPRRTPSR